ncbi:MAG TPA: cation:proton antiporter [Kofleriaceae bacterium]|nr:cation:proton antiporter [Kofleriaceae bacterium]
MTASRVLVELVVVLGTAAATTVVFQAARLPVVLGYVLAGLMIGPHVPVPLVADAGLVHLLSELGVILLMFTVGLELRLSRLARVGAPAALTAVFEVGLVVTGGALAARALGFTPTEAVFAGACLAISSTMLVTKAFEDRGWTHGFVDVVLAILVFEDIIAIVLLAVLGGIATGAGLAAGDIALLIARLAGFLVGALVGGLIVVPRVFRWIARRARPETLLISALALCFGVAAVADHAGFSVALGAFLAGILIAESGHGHDVFELVRPFRDVLAMVFFVSVGMMIAPAELAAEAPTIAVLSLVVLALKPLGVALGAFLGGYGVRPAVRSGLSLAQVGELSFVIAGIGAASGVARPSLLAIIVGVACVTTMTSAIYVGRSDAIAGWVAGNLPGPLATFESFYEAWLGRLRAREGTLWQRLRRPAVVLVADTAALLAVGLAASRLAPDAARAIGLHGTVADAVVLAAALAAAAPFAIGAYRRVARIARTLALEVVPDRGAGLDAGIDLGRAPRRALTLTLSLALGLAIAAPLAAVAQPLGSGGVLIVLAGLLALVPITYRSILDFDRHVRAGSELLLELMRHPDDGPEHPLPEHPLEDVERILPGFGGTDSIALPDGSAAVGRSLAELDLRARTGATVLAIARAGAGVATPSPTEPLCAGDVLAVAGSDEAIAAARAMLGAGEHLAPGATQ